MKIIGELNRCFGNFVTLRGFAKMGDLERISSPDDAYQRDRNEPHHEKMVQFLRDGEYGFFPELIFSAVLADNEKKRENALKFYDAIPFKSFRKTNFRGFSMQAKTNKTIDRGGDVRGGQGYCIGEFVPFNDDATILRRIDGNHRLSATKKAKSENTIVPFCIVLYLDVESAYKSNRVLFNNINFQQLPLTTEQNLKLLFGTKQDGGSYTFSDDDLEKAPGMGTEYVLARKLFESIKLDNLDAIASILKHSDRDVYTCTFLLTLCKLLAANNVTIQKEKFQQALREAESCYENYPSGFSKDYRLLIAHVYYSLKKHLKSFSNWVENNGMYLLQGCEPEAIISIFDSMMEAKRKTIFLAMSFDADARQNYCAIKEAVKMLNNDYNSGLKLKLIRIDEIVTGSSSPIPESIFNRIEDSGYLIADLSKGNQNVYLELGYRMGLYTRGNKVQENFLILHNKQVGNFSDDVKFNIQHYRVEIAENNLDLKNKVEEQLKKYYNL